MMIVSKYVFMDVVGLDGLKIQLDGSRIAASAVQAIGFIGVGVVVVKKSYYPAKSLRFVILIVDQLQFVAGFFV